MSLNNRLIKFSSSYLFKTDLYNDVKALFATILTSLALSCVKLQRTMIKFSASFNYIILLGFLRIKVSMHKATLNLNKIDLLLEYDIKSYITLESVQF